MKYWLQYWLKYCFFINHVFTYVGRSHQFQFAIFCLLGFLLTARVCSKRKMVSLLFPLTLRRRLQWSLVCVQSYCIHVASEEFSFYVFFFFFPSSNWSFNLTLVTCETYCFCGLHFVSGIVQQRVCVVVKAGTRRWSLQTRELRWCKADKEEKAVYRYSLQTSFKSHQNVDKNNTKGSFALSIHLFIWLFQSVFVVDVLLSLTHITCRDLSLCC